VTTPEPRVLFLCTGNYYRSRFAEHWFNHRAPALGMRWSAVSRGLRINRIYNPGLISEFAHAGLVQRGVPLPEPLREPLHVREEDLAEARLIVALKRSEHEPLLLDQFPLWGQRVRYWQVHDIDVDPPEVALPAIVDLVDALLEELRGAPSAPL
jgi:protein-tyrosine phosphatase